MHNAEKAERLLADAELYAVNGGFLPAQIVIAACTAAIVGRWDNHHAIPIETQAKALGLSHIL